jgi:superfamily II DNA or RNA helicase
MANSDLSKLDIKDTYRTYEGPSPVSAFFVPCLKNSKTYDRVAGFFSSGALRKMNRGLDFFAENGGKVRLITSPRLTNSDVDEIMNGYDIRKKVSENLEATLENIGREFPDELGYLGRLVAQGIVDIKIAFFNDALGAMFHEKWGLFEDENKNVVYFSGSNNETIFGQKHNAESFRVVKSWDGGASQRTIDDDKSHFERLWLGQVPSLEITPISEVSRDILARYADQIPADYKPTETGEDDAELIDDLGPDEAVGRIVLRDYQEDAIKAWMDNSGHGVLKMATGTGKTITAIGAINQLRETEAADSSLLILITCPLINLVKQWGEAVKSLQARTVLCYDGVDSWFSEAQGLINYLQLNNGVGVLITTHSTWARQDLKNLIERWNKNFLIISDEVHHMGSRRRRGALPKNSTYRLGLSATPERHNDEQGTLSIFSYFGPIVYELNLREAIKLGCLSRYLYYPVKTYLSEEETREYVKLSGQIAAILLKNGGALDDDDDDYVEFMRKIRIRNNLLGNCVNKLSSFRNEVIKKGNEFNQLVYCSEGKGLEVEKQLNEVMLILGIELEKSARPYISETSPIARSEILHAFSKAELQFVVSMKCLDEGVDLPDARIAYLLASSTDPRQWVQRRGRILRRSSSGVEKTAEIIDFITLPHPGGEPNSSVDDLITKEIARIKEFGSDSENQNESDSFITEIEQDYGRNPIGI